MKWIARACAGAIAIITLYLTAAVFGALLPGKAIDLPGGDDTAIYLLAGPIHYDLILPLDAQTRQAFGFLSETGFPIDHPDAAWLSVGWGSAAFYTATGDYTDIDPTIIWQAFTGDDAVMRMDLIGAVIWPADVPRVNLSDVQYAHLRGAILQGLARDALGQAQPVPDAGLTETDVFYAAKGHFSILQTCNVWIAETLRAAGVPMGRWTPTPFAVTLSRWWFN